MPPANTSIARRRPELRHHSCIAARRSLTDRHALLVLLSVTLLQLQGCNTQSDPSETAKNSANTPATSESEFQVQSQTQLPTPKSPHSEFLNTDPSVAYIGSQSCSSCHSEIADAFSHTSHSRALSNEPPTLPDASITDQTAGYLFRSQNVSPKLTHTAELQLIGNAPQNFEIAWTVGSGHFGHSFLALAGPFLIQSPLTWYTTRNCWDLSPGYTGPDHYAFHRTVSARCLYCHAGRTEVREQNEYFVDVIEQGISCERCHGPGSLHTAKHEAQSASSADNSIQPGEAAANSTIDLSIVNPARLSRQLAESVCEQCHLQGDAQVFVRGRRFDDFRPGLPLSSFRQEYRAQTHGQMTVVGHVEQMHSSACYKQSTTMTCVTCHHPHQTHQTGHVISPAEQAAVYRNACLSCHQTEHCSEQVTVRQTREDRCADCHMPKSPTELPHVAFTHHRIGLHTAESEANRSDPAQNGGRNSNQFTLVDLSNTPGPEGPDMQRNHGLALLQLTFKTGFPDGLRQSQQLLQQAWDGGAGDAAVATGLARIAEEIGWSEKSGEWSARALELDLTPSEDRCAALKIQAELDFAAGRYSSALKHLEELTRMRRDARHWFFRGMAEQNLNQTDNALQSLRTSLEIDPRNPGAHAALAAILNMKKLPDAGQHQKAAEVLLKPAAANR